MGFVTWLAKLDRRWIFLAMGLLVLGPLIRPLSLPLTVSRPVQGLSHRSSAATVRISLTCRTGATRWRIRSA